MKVRFTKTARYEIQEIYDYLASESPLARRGFEERLSHVVRDARDFPETGRLTNREGVRQRNTSPYPYLVFYRIRASEIVVIRVRHGARNPKSLPARPS